MTEDRAIYLLKSILPKKVSFAQMICASNCYGDEMVYEDPEPYAIEYAINSIQENTKLKAEIDRLNTQIAESNQEGVGILHDILELREENEKLKKEIENLLIDKDCWTCKHEELSPLSEPCYSCDDCVNWERKEQV